MNKLILRGKSEDFSAENQPIEARILRWILLLITAICISSLFASQISLFFERIRPLPLAILVLIGCWLVIRERCLNRCFRSGYLIILFYLLSLPASLLLSGGKFASLAILTIGSILIFVAPAYWSFFGVKLLVRAFVAAGVASYLILYRAAGVSAFLDSSNLSRLNLDNSHPNLLGYCAMVYFGASLLLIASNRWVYWISGLLLGGLSFVIMVKASSRGSFVASSIGLLVFLGLIIGSLMVNYSTLKKNSFRKLAAYLAGLVLIAFFVGGIIFSFSSVRVKIEEVMLVNDEYRGIGTGFSGRFDEWSEMWDMYSVPEFLFGIGVRETERSGIIIDNSYLVMAIENGVFGLLVFLLFLLTRLRQWLLFGDEDRSKRFFNFACVAFLFSVLANDFVARYLFSIGNPGAIIMFFVIGYLPLANLGKRNAHAH